jgi:amidohydrolase
MALKNKIKDLALDYTQEVISIRRHLHAHPELSFQEYNTSRFVAEKLKSFGLNPIVGIADTGIAVLITGKNPDKKVLALRADMDALPIHEKNEVSYKSKVNGIMHACGHDVHTASLLGTAKILNQLKNDFEGTVKLIFQPGEEKIPGGASLMIKEGILQNPPPSHIFGQHVMPHISSGMVGFKEGMYMASADEIYITVKGKGGHGAMPEQNIDPILIASHLIVALQQIVSRRASPKMPTVLSFGRITGEGATNVIPNEVNIEGTFRTLNEKWRSEAHAHMTQLAKGLVEGMGGECDFKILRGFPFLINEPELTNRAKNGAIEYLGADKVVDLDIWMAAEDFSYYSQEIDACFYRLGVRNEEKGITSSVHTPTFDIDEDALQVGCGLMAWLAINELNS